MPDIRPGVLWIFQHSIPMAFVFVTLRIGQHSRTQAADSIGNGHGGVLSAGEHKISQAHLLIYALLNKALINSLIVAADEN